MFDQDDPRSALSAPTQTPLIGVPVPPECVILADAAPRREPSGQKSWYVRGQNFVTQYTRLREGETIGRPDQPDEYMVLLPDPDTAVRITTADGTAEIHGGTLLIVPPGRSQITALTPVALTSLYSAVSDDLVALASNVNSFLRPRPDVAPFAPWPNPPGGFRLRTYSLDVPDQPGRFGRIWRCTTLMINVLPLQQGPRDPRRLSPHAHDDFEQASIGLAGEFVHHLRWPWSPDRTVWRNDEHLHCPSPSITVIPPTAIHTTEAVGLGVHQLVDLFSPPRPDFSGRPGWVLNADEYPAPNDIDPPLGD